MALKTRAFTLSEKADIELERVAREAGLSVSRVIRYALKESLGIPSRDSAPEEEGWVAQQ